MTVPSATYAPETYPPQAYPPEMNAFRLDATPGEDAYRDAAETFADLAKTFGTDAAGVLASAGQDAMRPGWTAAAQKASTTAYGSWLHFMMAECVKLSVQWSAVAASYGAARVGQVPAKAALQNRVDQAAAVATNPAGLTQPIITVLDATYVAYWTLNAAQMSAHEESLMRASTPAPLPPPPPLASQPGHQLVEPLQALEGAQAEARIRFMTFRFMAPVWPALLEPQQLAAPFQQAFIGPQQRLLSHLSSGLAGLGDGTTCSSERAGGASRLAGGPLVGGSSAEFSGMGPSEGGRVGRLRPALSAQRPEDGGGVDD